MKEINIAEILKNKPRGTKLYSPIFGECTFSFIQGVTDAICVIANDNREFFDYKGLYSPTGESLLFPSKYMRDLSKFAWKKGDLLINSCGLQCIFKEWVSDDYTKFNGCYSNSRDGYEDVSNAETAKFVKLDNNTAYGYIREIENRCGGKLNLESLEIEKTQPEFKDGDIVFEEGNRNYCSAIGVLKKDKQGCFMFDTFLTKDKVCYNSEYIFLPIRLATEEEKKQLFSALEKEGKAWDAEKKAIVDLKPVVELKPFDKVLVRNYNTRKWEADLFGFKNDMALYHCVGGSWNQCIPYESNEYLLGTTKDVED